MTIACLRHLAALVAILLSPPEMEQRAAEHVARTFERVGRRAPALEPSLSQAARALAERALETSAKDAVSVRAVAQAVSDAGGFDPSPRAIVIRGSPPQEALSSFLARTDAGSEPANEMGIGTSIRGDRGALVALLAARRVKLKPFPRLARPRSSHSLCGELIEPFRSLDVFVTRPDGEVDKLTPPVQDARFCASIALAKPGRYSIEVIGAGAQGPEVAALFFVDAGPGKAREPAADVSEPRSDKAARLAILERINSLRQAHGQRPVELDDALNSIAQAYSERMSSQNFFAHVAPDGSDLRSRLKSAGYHYLVAAENLGLAPGALAAHASIEQSPGHRRNLLDGRHARLGLGISYQGGQSQAVLTEILAQPSSEPMDSPGRGAAYRR